jgi:pimeloyl-ACP methyl ester carboxylesterase
MAPPLLTFGRWYPLPPLWLEGRVWLEFVALRRDPIFSGVGVPPGRNQPVMLIPGFMAGDRSLDTMRGWLKRNGYWPMRSGIELNVQSSAVLVERIAERIRAKVPRGKKVIVIGQSRGGTLGLGLAQKYPQLVERVIALGSPIASSMDIHPVTMLGVHAARAVHAIRRGPWDIDDVFDQQILETPKVPLTMLYSRSDGFVHWKACVRPDVDAVEVGGSHLGMSVNPRVYREIARVLKPAAAR